LKVHYTVDQAGIGRTGPAYDLVVKSIKDGWKIDLSLHNHNFLFKSENYRGGVAPSIPDSELYKSELSGFGLKRALITNGFDTLEIDSRSFHLLSSK